MQYKVEKDIPVPKGEAYTKYPFDEMSIGDSFFIEEYSREKMQSIGGAISNYKKTKAPKKRFKQLKYEGGIRVWRTRNGKSAMP